MDRLCADCFHFEAGEPSAKMGVFYIQCRAKVFNVLQVKSRATAAQATVTMQLAIVCTSFKEETKWFRGKTVEEFRRRLLEKFEIAEKRWKGV